MAPTGSRDRLVLLVTGLLLVLGPAVILVLTLGVLALFGAVVFNQITLVEFLELYLLELALFIGLSYGIYRLTLWLIQTQVPDAPGGLDTREPTDPDAN